MLGGMGKVMAIDCCSVSGSTERSGDFDGKISRFAGRLSPARGPSRWAPMR